MDHQPIVGKVTRLFLGLMAGTDASIHKLQGCSSQKTRIAAHFLKGNSNVNRNEDEE